MTEELKSLLECTPRQGDAMIGRKAKDRTAERAYVEIVKHFERLFGWASNDPKPHVYVESCTDRNGKEVEVEAGHGFAVRQSGFYADVRSGRFDDVEAQRAAEKAAEKYERDACEALAVLLQSESFVKGLRMAHEEARLSMVRRGYSVARITQDMICAVFMPELAGRGLPELLRRVVARGALAVAVWCAVVEEQSIGKMWDTVMRIGELEAAIKAEAADEQERADRADTLFLINTQISNLKADLARLEKQREDLTQTLGMEE